jgi:ankyrin repeat protein
MTPLNMAVYRDNVPMGRVVRCLIEAGARIGDTPLLVSALFGCYSAMHFLLEEAGANIDDVGNEGETIWDLQERALEKG